MGHSNQNSPSNVTHVRDVVVLRPYGSGSKSERAALMPDTKQGLLLLRRRGCPAFGETGLERWQGKTVSCSGTVVGQVLLVDRIEEK